MIDENRNCVVHAICAISPRRPPIPTSHFCLSNKANMDAHKVPNTSEGRSPGMTASRAIPEKAPHNVARANRSGKSVVAIIPTVLAAGMGPKARKLFKAKDTTEPVNTEAEVSNCWPRMIPFFSDDSDSTAGDPWVEVLVSPNPLTVECELAALEA